MFGAVFFCRGTEQLEDLAKVSIKGQVVQAAKVPETRSRWVIIVDFFVVG